MKVDISPNFPPRSSCTAEAPIGSGSDGGGSSACSRSMRMITWVNLRLGIWRPFASSDTDQPAAACPHQEMGNTVQARRSSSSSVEQA